MNTYGIFLYIFWSLVCVLLYVIFSGCFSLRGSCSALYWTSLSSTRRRACLSGSRSRCWYLCYFLWLFQSEGKLFSPLLDKPQQYSSTRLSKRESLKVQKKHYRREKKRAAKELLHTLKDPSVIVMADWMKIRGTLKSWTKLWCVLKPGLLVLYKSHKQKVGFRPIVLIFENGGHKKKLDQALGPGHKQNVGFQPVAQMFENVRPHIIF